MKNVKNEEKINAIAAEIQSLFIEFENIYRESLDKINLMTKQIEKELSVNEINE